MINTSRVIEVLEGHQSEFYPVLPLHSRDNISPLDLSGNNPAFNESIFADAANFIAFINQQRKKSKSRYLIGGYLEQRNMYRRSGLFDKNANDQTGAIEEPRSLHLGIDVWCDAGTEIFAPLGGMIHSLGNNNNFGDYGATIILQHQLDTINFYCLYGHLSSHDIAGRRPGQFITRGETFAHVGPWEENGNWPPHLHFQLIIDIGNWMADYPGVCKLSEASKYTRNCPNPNLILQMQTG